MLARNPGFVFDKELSTLKNCFKLVSHPAPFRKLSSRAKNALVGPQQEQDRGQTGPRAAVPV